MKGNDTPTITEPGDAEVDESPDVGARMGRYELVSVIGSGGMGVVFSARDPELDRTVAVKVLHGRSRAGEQRLRREGQTMARLTHGNVIRVYDVGEAHGRLFVAMEYIDGGTLQQWLDRERREPAAIVAAFVHAGRGLAAAHSAGLVHRDFKPHNVLVGSSDGRVLVTDFGLAQPSAAGPSVSLTGARSGTPAYMAPEQHAGEAVDARADQFSFCVALWHALFGVMPYPGATAAELAAAKSAGVIARPPATRGVPKRTRIALERGLRPRPADRWPAMDSLLDALAPRLRSRRAWVLVASALVVTAGAVAAWQLAGGQRGDDPCAVSHDAFAGVWDDAAAKEVEAAFASTGAPYAAEAYREVARELDNRRAAWLAMRRDSCEATNVRREQSDAMMDLRASCLAARLGEVRAYVDVLRHADTRTVKDAVAGANTVGQLLPCADIEMLGRRVPVPPARRDAVAAVEREIATARALGRAGHFHDAALSIDDVVARARSLGYAPALADALVAAAESLWRVDRSKDAAVYLDEAVIAADAGGDDSIRLDAELALVRVVGYKLERYDDGEVHAKRAEAILARIRADDRRRALLAYVRGISAWWNGHYVEARTELDAAVNTFRRIAPRGLDLHDAIHMRVALEDDAGDLDAALADAREALELARTLHGPAHPALGLDWGDLGGVLRKLQRYDEAKPALERALAISESAEGPETSNTAGALTNLATLYNSQKQYEAAIPLYRRGLAIFEKLLGPDHTQLTVALENLGGALSKAGQHAEAEQVLQRSLAINLAKLGPHAPQTASSHKQLGRAHLRAGKPERARAELLAAVRALEASQGAKSRMLVDPVRRLAEAELALHRTAAALAAYERALGLLRTDAADASTRKEIEDAMRSIRARPPANP